MTKEEAREAINEIINALEQNHCEDCISRKEVRKFVDFVQSIKDKHNLVGSPINYGTICDIVIGAHKLLDLPPVAPTQEWIPCSERLPEETGLYLITFKAYGGGYAVTLLYYEKPKKYWTRENIYQFGNDEVVAWMPLPKPYKEKQGSKVGWSSLENVREKVERGNKDDNNNQTRS